MKKVNRAQLRAKSLDVDCKKANTTSHEYGMSDNRVFCYGLYKEMSDWEIAEKCELCGAFVDNAKPLAELKGE